LSFLPPKNSINLKIEIARRGYPPGYIAARLGLQRSEFSYYLNGRRRFPGGVRRTVAKFLGVPELVLFGPIEDYLQHII
jgi:transcriptional regulator with XRE-family HTH domain